MATQYTCEERASVTPASLPRSRRPHDRHDGANPLGCPVDAVRRQLQGRLGSGFVSHAGPLPERGTPSLAQVAKPLMLLTAFGPVLDMVYGYSQNHV
jgi:hypothetical protein